ncbi:NlpC/P60 family protein [Paenactinomyces guangxiensis]|uniref:C40 family peptidase n=1 Tax=Paenactinomyces guangxiensis TaxID=1490290 RepID=A0A7W2A851_9BACL|nr:C40 family peptidase [Paenactinomyces guangxiensis]MBA4493458.1 C40 family peptidase [Paenactinomyces guangxiensis]MBH8590549.1 C40 family peptidase [Paenactinomyces guangxiensis]
MQVQYIQVSVSNLWVHKDQLFDEDEMALANYVEISKWFSQLPLRLKATRKRLESQLLYGEPVLIEQDLGDWLKVYAKEQFTTKSSSGYPGWIPSNHIVFNEKYHSLYSQGVFAYVMSKTANLELEDGTIQLLSFMTKLPLVKQIGEYVVVLTPQGDEAKLLKSHVAIRHKQEVITDIDLASLASQFLKVPFIGGGASSFGFDCSGLLFRLYQAKGIQVPRDVNDQITHGQNVPLSEIKTGDLLYFKTDPEDCERVSHAGIYIGNSDFISARRTGMPIRVSSLSENYYKERFWGARRYVAPEI